MGGAGAGGGGGAGVGGGPVAGAGAGGGGAGGPAGDPVQGKTVYTSSCSLCHGTDAVGASGPNITGSMTAGIGAWSEAEFNRAIREAKDRTGQALCFFMVPTPATTISDVQLKDLRAYLLSLSNDTPNRGSSCP
jgi:mono/diheme cytochrome c family protein